MGLCASKTKGLSMKRGGVIRAADGYVMSKLPPKDDAETNSTPKYLGPTTGYGVPGNFNDVSANTPRQENSDISSPASAVQNSQGEFLPDLSSPGGLIRQRNADFYNMTQNLPTNTSGAPNAVHTNQWQPGQSSVVIPEQKPGFIFSDMSGIQGTPNAQRFLDPDSTGISDLTDKLAQNAPNVKMTIGANGTPEFTGGIAPAPATTTAAPSAKNPPPNGMPDQTKVAADYLAQNHKENPLPDHVGNTQQWFGTTPNTFIQPFKHNNIAGSVSSAISKYVPPLTNGSGAQPPLDKSTSVLEGAPAKDNTQASIMDTVQKYFQPNLAIDNRASNMASRANVSRAATGGMVRGPGTTTSDSIPAHLSTGEAVLPAKTVGAMGGPEVVKHIIRTTNGKEPQDVIHKGGHYADAVVDTPRQNLVTPNAGPVTPAAPAAPAEAIPAAPAVAPAPAAAPAPSRTQADPMDWMKQQFANQQAKEDQAGQARMDYADQVESKFGPYLGQIMGAKIRNATLAANQASASKSSDVALTGAPREELAGVRAALYANKNTSDSRIAGALDDINDPNPAIAARGHAILEAEQNLRQGGNIRMGVGPDGLSQVPYISGGRFNGYRAEDAHKIMAIEQYAQQLAAQNTAQQNQASRGTQATQ